MTKARSKVSVLYRFGSPLEKGSEELNSGWPDFGLLAGLELLGPLLSIFCQEVDGLIPIQKYTRHQTET